MLYGLDYQKCPWVWEDIAPEAYLKMGKVTSVTFSYTFLHAFLYMLCRGWSLTIHTVDRNQATNVTMVMGLIYLMYSAYFLSIDFSGMMEFVNIVLAFVYLILGIINFQSLTKQIYLVRQFLLNADETIPAAFQQSVRLKFKMLRQLQIVVLFFYLPKFILFSYEGVNPENEFAKAKLITTVEFIDMVNFVGLLWIFRPRKQWPEYFSMGLGDQFGQAAARNQQNRNQSAVV